MGRSQVQRNRTHGRPGSKGGRSGHDHDGRKGEMKRSFVPSLDSNSFRYENSRYDDTEIQESENDDDYENFSNNHDFGPSHYSIARNIYEKQDEYEHDLSGVNELDNDQSNIDLTKLSMCLDRDTTLRYLRLDDRMTEMFRKRFVDGKKDAKMTVSEIRALGDNFDQMQVLKKDEDNTMEEVTVEVSHSNREITNTSGESNNGEEGVDDLEDWLDGMIGT